MPPLLLALVTALAPSAVAQESAGEPGAAPAQTQERAGGRTKPRGVNGQRGEQGGTKEEAQETPKTKREQGEEGKRPRPSAESRDQQGPAQKDRVQKGKETRGAPATLDGAGPGGNARGQGLAKKLALEERKHRERVAKIARLRELAEKKNQTERIAALDRLLERENTRYKGWMVRGHEILGADFASVEAKLRKGRRPSARGKKPAQGTDPAPRGGKESKDESEKTSTPEKEEGGKEQGR